MAKEPKVFCLEKGSLRECRHPVFKCLKTVMEEKNETISVLTQRTGLGPQG